MKFVKAVVLVVVLLFSFTAGHVYGYGNKDKTATTKTTWSTASHETAAKPMIQTNDEVRARTHVEGSKIKVTLYVLLFIIVLAMFAILGLIRLGKIFAANRRSFKSAIAQRVGPVFGTIHPRNGDTVPIRVRKD